MTKVCHLTSVHKAHDTRIYMRECLTLAAAGYEVYLVAPSHKDEEQNGVKIKAVKAVFKNRFLRMLITTTAVLIKAVKVQARIYHLHDPELIACGLVLKLLGKKVIFDVHENVAAQIKTKNWLPFRYHISKIYRLFDWIAAKCFHLVLAENSYEKIYKPLKANYVVVLNMPDLDFFKPFVNTARQKNENVIFYMGGVTLNRGMDTIIKALNFLKNEGIAFRFECVGPYEKKERDVMHAIPEFESVKEQIIFYGWKNLDIAYHISVQAKIGLSILKPIENYLESYSTKVFEYMAVGLPFITSDFPLYKSLIVKSEAGLSVDPNDAAALAVAMKKLLTDEALQKQLSQNGIVSAEHHFNWKFEAEKLLGFYRKIAGS